jgi:Flp pilus assembly CpaF family ATPase
MTIYRPGIKILTAENPIEYVYENITQCEVNEKIGNTFANYIRAFLRQDPEVIMVGEIRDSETAQMALRAAQTGHMVLSTLHTNDTFSSIMRLFGLGSQSNRFLLGGSRFPAVDSPNLPELQKRILAARRTDQRVFHCPAPGYELVYGSKVFRLQQYGI